MGRKLLWLVLIALAALLLCGRTAVGQSEQEKVKRRPKREKVEQRQAKPRGQPAPKAEQQPRTAQPADRQAKPRDRAVPRDQNPRGARPGVQPRDVRPRNVPQYRHPRPQPRPRYRPPYRPNRRNPFDYRLPYGHYGWRLPYRHYRFPYAYPYRPFLEFRFFFGFPFRPHEGYWSAGVSPIWFYWPYYDQPQLGCGWYWVPTQRILQYDAWGDPYWYYYDYQYLYLCFD